MTQVPRVVLESPYTAVSSQGLIRNRNYLRACVLDSIARGEAPWAGHGFYTQYLNDRDLGARLVGIRLSQSWLFRADLVAVYTDLGTSRGMEAGIAAALRVGVPIEYRQLGRQILESLSDRPPRRPRKSRS